MLFVLNKPNVKQALNRNNEKNKNPTHPIVESLKSTKKKTEEIFLIHEQSYLNKKEIINTALKSQMADINVRLENRRFSKGNTLNKIILKKPSLFLGIIKFLIYVIPVIIEFLKIF